MPSAFSSWFRTTSPGSSRRPQRPSPKRYAFFDEFTEKAVEGCLGQCGDRRLRFSSSWELSQSHLWILWAWYRTLTSEFAQQWCRRASDCYAGGLRRYTSQVVGKNQQLFACTVRTEIRREVELTGNLIRDSDSHSDTDIRRRRMIFRSCMTEFLTCTISCHRILSVMKTVPNKTEVCNSDTKWMWNHDDRFISVIWESKILPRKQIKHVWSQRQQ